MRTFSTTRVTADRDAVERIVKFLRKTNAIGAYFDEGIAIIDFRHVDLHKRGNGLLEALETCAHEYLHHTHRTWSNKRIDRVLHPRLHLLKEFVKSL